MAEPLLSTPAASPIPMDRRATLRLPAPPDDGYVPWRRPPLTTEPIETAPGRIAPAGLPLRVKVGPERPTTTAAAPVGAKALSTAGGLEPYVPSASAPWTMERVLHLLHRTGFGASASLAAQVLADGPSTVDALVDRVAAMPLPDLPAWYDESFPPWESDAYRVFLDAQDGRLDEYQWDVYRGFLGDHATAPLDRAAVAFRERLALMWSNHFVTEHETYYFSPFLARYWGLMRRHALGDFRQFVHDVGIDPAMLVYLNGWENRRGAPNENYARELLELFTMGITDAAGTPNYTQGDIEELSRALTGWSIDFQGTMDGVFYDFWHDRGTKVIFGRRGSWGYDDIVPLLFEERPAQIADFICRMLYREFVYDVPHDGVIAEMAALFRQHDFRIEPVVRALLNSAHFFDAAVIRARIQSPVERSMGLWTTLEAPVVREALGWLRYQLYLANQIVFEPWNVAGWPGGRTWVDTSTLPIRWFADSTTLWIIVDGLRPFALSLASAYEARAFVRDTARLLLGTDPSDAQVDTYTGVLLDTIPEYEWDPNAEGAEIRIRAFLEHLTRLPEFQLA